MPEINYTTKNLVSIKKGNLPILLTCPHDGNVAPKGVPEREKSDLPSGCHKKFNKLTDSFTHDITVGIYKNIFLQSKKKPNVVLAEGHRKFFDLNRPKRCAYKAPQAKKYYDAYHLEITRFIRKIYEENKNGTRLGFLFDIHGTRGISKYKADIIIGTNNGKSISHLLKVNPNAFWDEKGLIESLKKRGYKTSPREKSELEIPELNGGYTVTTYGSTRGDKGLEAIQIEISSSIRKNISKRKRLERTLARSIIRFVSQY